MKTRALVRVSHDNKHITVLCPLGHLIEWYELNQTFAGSMLECELGNRHPGDRWDRLAAKCTGAGH